MEFFVLFLYLSPVTNQPILSFIIKTAKMKSIVKISTLKLMNF